METQRARFGWCLLCLMVLILFGCPASDNHKKDAPQKIQPESTETTTAKSDTNQPDATNRILNHTTFLFTSDFKGFQRPCGCAMGQHGGLLRLATITEKLCYALSEQDTTGLSNYSVTLPAGLSGDHALWPIDCGNFADGLRRLSGLRAKTHLVALAQAGAVAAVINTNELILSEAEAMIGLANSPVPLTCCNVTINLPGVELSRFVQLARNWYLVGLAATPQGEHNDNQGGWWKPVNPLESVAAVLAELPDDANVVVIATHQPDDVIGALRKLEVRAVIGGESAIETEVSESLAPRFDAPGGMGRKLQLLSFDEELGGGFEPWFVVAGEEWPDDPAAVEILNEFQIDLKKQLSKQMAELYGIGGFDNIAWGMDSKYLPPSEQIDITFDGLHYVGTAKCLECHAGEYDVWRQSKHAFAWDSLVEMAEQETLDCLQCHTTGMLEPGGYLPFAHNAGLVSVGCESCHSAGSDHIEWALTGADDSIDNQIASGSIEVCLECHDSYNSPDFNADKYWQKIMH